ncbi:MAG: type I methionyl aminopeptidase [Ardenticatenaceae bacterium]|nr:type I methionyl aminopeptidase [Ardenticatenaceae bacterium]
MSIESEQDLRGLARIGKIVGLTLREMKMRLRPGLTTGELDEVGARILAKHGARPAPQRLYGFPGATCISVNDEAVHGIPGGRILRAGDLVKIDVTAELDGYIADAALTVALPPVSATKRKLRDCAKSALREAIAVARAGCPIYEIGKAVETEVRRHGFAVIPELSGHGVGRAIHEEPPVPNFADRRVSQRLTEGLVITIEPIIAAGSGRVVIGTDGWTVRTGDGSLAAHYEHTVVITRDRPIVLTVC